MTISFNWESTAELIADSIVALFPVTATCHDAMMKKWIAVQSILKGRLQQRAAEGAQSIQLENKKVQGLPIDGHTMPGAATLAILQFAPQSDRGKMQIVSKTWCGVASQTQVWQTCAMKMQVTNMTMALEILKRPQFASLANLRLLCPSLKLGKTGMKKIAACCPGILELDLGLRWEYADVRSGVVSGSVSVGKEELESVVSNLAQLRSLALPQPSVKTGVCLGRSEPAMPQEIGLAAEYYLPHGSRL